MLSQTTLKDEFAQFSRSIGPSAAAGFRDRLHHNWPINVQIGNTPLLRLYGLEGYIKEVREGKFPNTKIADNFEVWAKVEGLNFTSTHKDRASLAHCLAAIAQNKGEVTIATCGNAGESLAAVAASMNLRCTVYLPRSAYSEKLENRISATGATLIIIEGTYDDAVETSEFHAAVNSETIYDANSGSIHRTTEFEAYATVALEIYEDLHKLTLSPKIASVAGPVGNGAFFVGVYRGFQECVGRDLLGVMPKFVGGTNNESNPLLEAFTSGRRSIPTKARKFPSSCQTVAPLATDAPSCANEALRALRDSQGTLKHVDRASLEKMMRKLDRTEGVYLREQEIRPILAGLAGLQALFDELTESEQPKIGLCGTHIAIITGIHD